MIYPDISRIFYRKIKLTRACATDLIFPRYIGDISVIADIVSNITDIGYIGDILNDISNIFISGSNTINKKHRDNYVIGFHSILFEKLGPKKLEPMSSLRM